MVMRSLLGVLVGLSVGLGAAIACSNYVPPDVPTYGPPGALQGKAPLFEGDGGGGGTVTEDAGGGGGGEGGGVAEFYCQTQGGILIADAGPCTVSFQQTIYKNMQAGGSWNCAAVVGCHGNTSTPLAPSLTGTTAQSFYDTLANYSLAYGTPITTVAYVNPCSTNPAESGFACNTASTGTCSIEMPSGVPLSATDQQTIATWVACGAPFN
jgi:hypothetical protein